MTRRPSVLAPAQLRDAARRAVSTAVEERTVALSEAEAHSTAGGAYTPPAAEPGTPVLKPVVAGGIYPSPTVLL